MYEVVKNQDWDYKDMIRHGGRKRELLETFGPLCQMCYQKKEDHEIHAHHVIKGLHEFQVLLCNSCHQKLHAITDDEDKIKIPVSMLSQVLNSSPTVKEAAKKLSLSKHGMYYKRKKYNLVFKKCSFCGQEFKPSRKSPSYCSKDCQTKGKLQKLHERQKRYHGKKLENDKRYYLLNREENLKKQKEYALKNKERLLQYRREYYQKHKR